MTPQSLNELASEWSNFILTKPHLREENTSKHVQGKYSIYEQRFDIINANNTISFYYIGCTGREFKRQSEHISEFVRCSVKTKHGKSSIYDSKYMAGAHTFGFSYIVLEGGYESEIEAKKRENELAAKYAQIHTAEFMVSNQNRTRGRGTRTKFKRVTDKTRQ